MPSCGRPPGTQRPGRRAPERRAVGRRPAPRRRCAAPAAPVEVDPVRHVLPVRRGRAGPHSSGVPTTCRWQTFPFPFPFPFPFLDDEVTGIPAPGSVVSRATGSASAERNSAPRPVTHTLTAPNRSKRNPPHNAPTAVKKYTDLTAVRDDSHHAGSARYDENTPLALRSQGFRHVYVPFASPRMCRQRTPRRGAVCPPAFRGSHSE